MDMRTVPIGISLLMGQHAFEWNEMMAMSVLGALPLLRALSDRAALLPRRHDRRLGQELKRRDRV